MKLKSIYILIVLLLISMSAFADTKLPPVKGLQSSVTVTSTDAEISAEYLRGRHVFIQNNDASGIVYLNLSGAATATDTMTKLEPGDSINYWNITNSIHAIGSIASNANVSILVTR